MSERLNGYIDNPSWIKTCPDKVLDAIWQHLNEGKNDNYSLSVCCERIGDIAEQHPQKAAKAFEVLQPIIFSDDVAASARVLTHAGTAVDSILKADPKLADKGFEAIKAIIAAPLKPDFDGTDSLFTVAVNPIHSILKNKPEMAEDIKNLICTSDTLNYVGRDLVSVTSLSEIAKDIVTTKPELKDSVVLFVEEALKFAPEENELEVEEAKEILSATKKIPSKSEISVIKLKNMKDSSLKK